MNAEGQEYGNALQAAASEGHAEIVMLLLDKVEDINAWGEEYSYAFQAASLKGDDEIATLLKNRRESVCASEGNVLHENEDSDSS
ncbi:hypothetical protein AX14_007546, partial [Amanita brunnescens Koide BX004]